MSEWSVLLRYPTWLTEQMELDLDAAGQCYWANCIEAPDMRSAIAAARREATMAQPNEHRRGLTTDSWAVLLVLRGHHKAELMR
jgi:hypothetical protein